VETQWFPASKEVQDTQVIKQGAGLCLMGQIYNFACRLPGKGCNHHDKVLLKFFSLKLTEVMKLN
jgi:hypothetical protein